MDVIKFSLISSTILITIERHRSPLDDQVKSSGVYRHGGKGYYCEPHIANICPLDM